jgi:phage gp46-like protein
VLALAYDNAAGQADLLRTTDGSLVSEGLDLETAVIVSLFVDGEALPGDRVDEDAPRRGWWGDVYEDDGERIGSRLWLLERATASQETASRAETYAREALAWMLSARLVKRVEVQTEIEGETVFLSLKLTLREGRQRVYGPFALNREWTYLGGL